MDSDIHDLVLSRCAAWHKPCQRNPVGLLVRDDRGSRYLENGELEKAALKQSQKERAFVYVYPMRYQDHA